MSDRATNPFETLFVDYVHENISELNWHRFQAVCDLQSIFPKERLAFATFFADSRKNAESIYLPKACEAELLFDEIRVDELGLAIGF
ncbi:MAG: hypothetical protein HKN43_04900 [Rhodothermales bacterium]|nr:hypothetical protein [Rhodothermales bacterium]